MLSRRANHQGWKRAVWLLGVMICVIAISAIMPSSASVRPLHTVEQSLLLGQLPTLTNPPDAQSLPVGVERRGTLEAAGVRLDGQELFRIASPAVLDRSRLDTQIPVEVRAKQIEANLKYLIPNRRSSVALDPKTLEVVIQTLNQQPVLFVRDDSLAEAKVLLTVTDADAQYHSISKARLAERWQEILVRELRQSIELRQPEALWRQTTSVSKVLAATLLLTFLLGIVSQALRRRQRQLAQQQAAESRFTHSQDAQSVEPPTQETPILLELRYYFNLERRLQTVRLLRWLLFWMIVLLWAAGVAYGLSAFPQTRQFARKVMTAPVVILIAWFLMGLTNRLVDFAIDRFIQNKEQEQSLTAANLQRIATIARVCKGLKTVLVYAIVILWLLQWFNIVPGSVLTLGAVFTLVISFASQNLVRDLVNGFLILLEDQFRIGDNVKIGSTSGMVENMNLRVTQIRTDEGGFITLPNSLIGEVENRSRTWARTDFRVEVAYNTDIDHALMIVRETVDQMEQDLEWQPIILDTHELFGVDQISHTGITIRIWIKTAPLKQWAIARELRRRLKVAFDHHSIQIGIPQLIMLENKFDRENGIVYSQISE